MLSNSKNVIYFRTNEKKTPSVRKCFLIGLKFGHEFKESSRTLTAA